MNKAYDRIECGFIRGIMVKMRFEACWINKILNCVSSASYSFLLNGEVKGKVIPKRGLRQGYPLSPYLFLFCDKGLSVLLNQAEGIGRLHGIKVVRSAPSISHLLFEDDCLIFAKTTVKECLNIRGILEDYEVASGQPVNFEKSALSFSPNIIAATKNDIKVLFNIDVVSCHDRYISLPSMISRNKRQLFNSIKDKVWQKL
ncbi:hypothetical protein ACOSP7_010426 [Xanthoceras sorbifolium]